MTSGIQKKYNMYIHVHVPPSLSPIPILSPLLFILHVYTYNVHVQYRSNARYKANGLSPCI